MAIEDTKSLKINVIGNKFKHDNDSCVVDIKGERMLDDQTIISIGYKLLESVKTMDLTFAGMITNTYFNCVLLATLTLYTASSVIFQDAIIDLWLMSFAGLLIFFLSMSRLARLTQSGHRLMKEMKECAYLFERYKFNSQGIDMEEVDLLRKDLRYVAESPIAPFAAFSLSSSTLLGACGMIVTYIIVLLQFKVSESGVVLN